MTRLILKKSWIALAFIFVFAAMFAVIIPTGTALAEQNQTAQQTGWKKTNGKWYYISPETGKKLRGTHKVNGVNEYFDKYGKWSNKTPKKNYTGRVRKGPNAKLYYFKKGKLGNAGFISASGKKYYVKKGGLIAEKEWIRVGGKRYYAKANGVIAKKWLTIGKYRYYFNSVGQMQKSWQKISGKQYYFNSSGRMAKSKWLKKSGKKVYMTKTGAMAKGWQTIGKYKYYFRSSGQMLKGWQKIKNKQYYFSTTGKMAASKWLTKSGKKVYMTKNGVMAKGWQTIGKDRYYFTSSGAMVKGWRDISKKRYYFKSNGAMVKSDFVKISGKSYYLQANGVMAKGWLEVSKDQWFWFNSSGVMAKGRTKINGKTYVFSQTGVWLPPLDGVKRGIDVSAWQGVIDWKEVKESGLADFAIIRAVRFVNGENKYYIDQYFEANVRAAKANGIDVGVYNITVATNKKDIDKEINFFHNSPAMQRLRKDGIKLDYPVFFDLEEEKLLGKGTTKASRTNLFRYGMQQLETKGYRPGFYLNYNWAANYINAAQLTQEGFTCWLARYFDNDPNQPPTGKPSAANAANAEYAIWQYSSIGSVPGISGNADLNYSFYKF